MTLVKFNNGFSAPVNRFNSWDSLFDSWVNGWDSVPSFQQAAANILETDHSFVIEMALPGLEKKDISISLENNLLTISHEQNEEKKEENYRVARREFTSSSFSRSFRMSRWVDSEKIEASFEKGILRIEIQKREEAVAKPARVIEIA